MCVADLRGALWRVQNLCGALSGGSARPGFELCVATRLSVAMSSNPPTMSTLDRQQLIRGTTSSAPSTLRAATIMVNSSACALWKSRSLYTVYAYDPVAWLG